jgi:acid phosphatase family membrane protein YuiD
MEETGKRMPRYGGMPSAHTAFAFSLLTMAGVVDGVMSVSFAVVASITIFVIDDALRMRVFLGGHGHALHRLVNKLPPEERRDFPYLETHLGHRPMEVTVGAIIGVGLTLLIMWLAPICCGLVY